MESTDKYRINVRVKSVYVETQSDPGLERYVFAYTVTIQNVGSVPARLLTRHWIITDADNQVQEVQGDGVVGEQPYLLPGGKFKYTSGTIIKTPVGVMEGSYKMRADDGTEFAAQIPVFTLATPRTLH